MADEQHRTEEAAGTAATPDALPVDLIKAVIDLLPVGVALFDANRRLIVCNVPFRHLFGLPSEACAGPLPSLDELGPLAAALDIRRAPLPGGRGCAVVCGEIGDRAAADKLRQSEALYRLLTEDVRDVVWKLDRDLRFTYISPADERLRGFRADEVVGHHVFEMFTAEGVAAVTEIMQQRQAAERQGIQTGAITFEVQHRCKDGRLLWGEVFSTPDRDAAGAIIGFHGITREITERKEMEEQVRQLAFYDTLTGLPNRRLLDDRLLRAMAVGQRSGRYGALMFLDLDNFKPLNDQQGHELGDLLLCEAAARLKRSMRASDTIARIGGDEFVAMLGELSADPAESRAQAAAVADKIRLALSEPYLLTRRRPEDGDAVVRHRCSVSIGVALFRGHETGQGELLKRADAAMYRAKEAGRDAVRFHEAGD